MRVGRATDALWRATPTTLLVCGPSGEILEVALPGVDVWELLGEPLELEVLVERVAERYDLAPAELADAIGALVARLHAEGLVVEVA